MSDGGDSDDEVQRVAEQLLELSDLALQLRAAEHAMQVTLPLGLPKGLPGFPGFRMAVVCFALREDGSAQPLTVGGRCERLELANALRAAADSLAGVSSQYTSFQTGSEHEGNGGH